MFGFFRMPRFIRRFIRRRTAHIPEKRAISIREKLSIAYAFAAWNLFGLLAFMIYRGKYKKHEEEGGEQLSQGQYFINLLGLEAENLKLHRVQGFRYMGEVDINKGNVAKTEASNEDEKLNTSDDEELKVE